LAIQILQIVFW